MEVRFEVPPILLDQFNMTDISIVRTPTQSLSASSSSSARLVCKRGRNERSYPIAVEESMDFVDVLLRTLDEVKREFDCNDRMDMIQSHSRSPLTVDVMHGLIERGIKDLVTAALARGDVAGADAWQIALQAYDVARAELTRARERQTWIVDMDDSKKIL